jgi:predicted Zn-dependent protease
MPFSRQRIDRLLGAGAIALLGLSACAEVQRGGWSGIDGPGIKAPDVEAAGLDEVRSEQAIQDPAAMMRLAEAAEQSANPVAAAVFYRRAIVLDASLIPAHLGLARALSMQGQLDEAINVLQRIHQRAPSNDEVQSMLNRLLAARKASLRG